LKQLNIQHSTSKEEKNQTEKYRQKTFSDENLIDRIPYWKLSFESSMLDVHLFDLNSHV